MSAGIYSGWSSTSISALFGGGSSSGLTSLLGEYNSIRSGAYYKAARQYFNNLNTDTATSVKTTARDRQKAYNDPTKWPVSKEKSEGKVVDKSKDTASVILSDTKALSSSVDKLTSDTDSVFEKKSSVSKDGLTENYDSQRIYNALSSFASNYNKVLDDAEKNTNTGLSTAVSSMKGYTTAAKTALSQFGVTVSDKGRLSVDKDKVLSSDLSKAESLFKKDYSYGDSIARLAKRAYSSAQSGYSGASGSYNAAGSYSAFTNSNWLNTLI